MSSVIMTLIIGFLFGYIALKIKIPAGAMVGAMFSIAIFNIITGDAALSQDVKILTQMAAGAFIGSGITSKDISGLKKIIVPAILMVLGIVFLNLFMGYLMHKITGIDLITSLFACAPGGIVDMTLVSSDLGADTPKVAVLQLVRFISVMTIIPAVVKIIAKIRSRRKREVYDEGALEIVKSNRDDKRDSFTYKEKAACVLRTLAIAFAAGIIGYISKIPAGALTFSMISAAAYNITTNKAYMPIPLRRITQILAGILVGERMNYGDLIALKAVMFPALLLILGIITVNLLLALFINRISSIDIITALFACTPGGVADMALIAEELGADGPKVTVLQLCRYVCVIALFPIIIKFIIT
ncbi:AbrB family transcriptional regulator [Clostridium polynesiense]|uniref:AbrB family transcriptional regulator n=1 Tax=Clostridium polynesiense TaxID=1325933 RepID=UPI00058BB897|nr:AbrB family transcriptional regulator [Clostridium polynesiense]